MGSMRPLYGVPVGREQVHAVQGSVQGPGDQLSDPASDTGAICGEFDIRIAADGTWFYHGSPIDRKPLVRLFARVLRREEAGEYWLVTPAERGRIRVDDAPFVAVALSVAGAGERQRITFRTNHDDEVGADAAHPIRVAERPCLREPAPYVLVRDRLEAKIARPVFYQLVELGVEERAAGASVLGVWSAGIFFPLGALE